MSDHVRWSTTDISHYRRGVCFALESGHAAIEQQSINERAGALAENEDTVRRSNQSSGERNQKINGLTLLPEDWKFAVHKSMSARANSGHSATHSTSSSTCASNDGCSGKTDHSGGLEVNHEIESCRLPDPVPINYYFAPPIRNFAPGDIPGTQSLSRNLRSFDCHIAQLKY